VITVPSDPDEVKAEAVSSLRGALISRSGVAKALRWCWYRNPVFPRRCSPNLCGDGSAKDATCGCSLALWRGPEPCSRKEVLFPSREAEALLRFALGEVALLDAVDPDLLSYPEIAIVVLDQIFREWQPDQGHVEHLLEWVAVVARASLGACGGAPGVAATWTTYLT
jgi:hypothetical protein